MADTDTVEKRVDDLEQMVARLPEDLDARFAGVDVKLASIREVLALHTTRFTKLESRLAEIDRKMDARFEKMDARFEKMDGRFDEMDARFERMDARFDEILGRLPKT